MHLNKKWVLLILGVLIVIIFSLPKEKEHIDYKVNSVNLTIYGLSRNLKSYNLDNDQLISSLVKTINSVTLLENEVAGRKKFDLPKGESYELDFIGSREKKVLLIEGYCIYEDVVYKVNDYQKIIQNLKESFEISDE